MCKHRTPATAIGRRFPEAFAIRPAMDHGVVHTPECKPIRGTYASDDSCDATHESANNQWRASWDAPGLRFFARQFFVCSRTDTTDEERRGHVPSAHGIGCIGAKVVVGM